MMLRFVSAAAMVAGVAGAALAQVNYIYDDGQMDTAVGPPSSFNPSPQMGWGNYFVAEEGGEWITTVSAAFGPTFPNLTTVTAWIFDDPDDDFNPGNAVALASVTLTPQTIGGSVFTDFNFAPTLVSGGFFVLLVTDTVAGQDRPAPTDTSGRTDVSWIVYNPVDQGVNIDNLAANALFSLAAPLTPFDGVWMIRASGIPAPGAGALLALGGLAAARRRR